MRHTTFWILNLLILAGVVPTAYAQPFGEWADPVHLDWPINTEIDAEMNPALTRDGLTMYFLRYYDPNIFAVHRNSVDEPWGEPQFLGDVLGDGVVFSRDGHRAYFSRVAADGRSDIYMSRRQDKDDDFHWSAPEDLGPAINTPANEYYPFFYEDDASGVTSLYFATDRAGTDDIYVSVVKEDGTFSEPVPVQELNSPKADRRLQIRRDGLECVWMSNRVGSILNRQGVESLDLWMARRGSTSEPWSAPEHMQTGTFNTGRAEGAPHYSFDGTELYFHAAQRPGNFGIGCPDSATCYFDIWYATRKKLTGKATEK